MTSLLESIEEYWQETLFADPEPKAIVNGDGPYRSGPRSTALAICEESFLERMAPFWDSTFSAGEKVEAWISSSWIIQATSALYLKVTMRNSSYEQLLGYSHALDGDLEAAHKIFSFLNDTHGLLFIADRHLDSLEGRTFETVLDLKKEVAFSFDIYTTELSDLNWTDGNLCRIATLYRDNGFVAAADNIENSVEEESKKKKEYPVGLSLPLKDMLPHRTRRIVDSVEEESKKKKEYPVALSMPYMLSHRSRQRIVDKLGVPKWIKQDDSTLCGMEALYDGDVPKAMKNFSKAQSTMGFDYMLHRYTSEPAQQMIRRARNDLVERLTQREMERKRLLKKVLKGFVSH